MKLAFLGPAPPFRGGIVTYYGMLARTLVARGHEVFWASFRRQYPKFLFPGTEQEGETAAWLDHPDAPRFVPWSPWMMMTASGSSATICSTVRCMSAAMHVASVA